MTAYKQTELGLIPSDWEVVNLEYIAEYISSGKTNTNNFGRFVLYGSTGIIGTCEIAEYKGDAILIARVGANAGKVSFVTGEYGISDNTIIIKICHSTDIYFIKNILQLKKLNNLVFGSGQPLITGTQLKKLKIPLPPKPEQTAIATALSDTDALLAELEKLLAKKQAIKTATMQQLLTGKTRLPEFAHRADGTPKGSLKTEWGDIPEDWEVVALGDLCNIQKGELITSDTKKNGNIPVIAGGKKPAYFHNIANRNGKTITISASGASAGFVNFFTQPIFASDCSTISESEKYNIEFIYYSLVNFQMKIYGMQTGGAQPHVQPSDLKPLLIPITNKPEQTVIAQILSDMDSEITALQARIEKLREIKQGMMQNLLTGKIRLPF